MQNGTSVIIPAYNCRDTLERAVGSALEQNPAPLQVLVVDDGSTDDTLAVARSLGDSVTVTHQENAGPAAARNRGVQQARGEYIGFLDADDYWLPGFLKECQAFLDSQSKAVAVSTGLQFVKLNGKVRTLIPPNSHGNTPAGQPFIIDDFFSYWAEHDHIRTGSCLIRRTVLDRVGGQNVALRVAKVV
jgi:glycosyltransferase involved in cell wall biosynthesis